MPVYNTDQFVGKAIESILGQTYQRFEFIIVDDRSTDHSWDILKKNATKDKRIILLKNKYNLGVSKTVKKAIDHARGALIARMDADDIALQDRLKKQVDYLTMHPATIAVGGQCIVIDSENNKIGEKKFPTDFKQIYDSIFTFFPVQEPTLMIARHKLPTSFNYYVKNGNTAEEVELIFKLFQYGRVENLPDVLLQYRIHNHNSSLKNIRKTFYQTLIGRFKGVFLHGYIPSIKDIAVNIIQLIIIMCIPQKISLWIYYKTRKIIKDKKNQSRKLNYAFSSKLR